MDWKKLVTDIQARGYSQAAIGKAIGRSQVYVADIIKGRYCDLKWSDGQALRRFHRKVVRHQAA